MELFGAGFLAHGNTYSIVRAATFGKKEVLIHHTEIMLTEELERLGKLLQQGILTEEEFAKAKALLLSKPPGRQDLSLLNWQTELERIDREWAQLEEKYKITVQHGRRVLPATRRRSLFTSIVGSLGICFLVIKGFIETKGGLYFLVFGIIMIALLIGCGLVETIHRTHYEEARAHYEKQRTEHLQRRPS